MTFEGWDVEFDIGQMELQAAPTSNRTDTRGGGRAGEGETLPVNAVVALGVEIVHVTESFGMISYRMLLKHR